MNFKPRSMRFSLCTVIFSVFIVSVKSEDVRPQCVMRGDCGDKKPCVYNQEPLPLNTSSKAFQNLKDLCLQLNVEADNRICCDEKQVDTFITQFQPMAALLQRCASCYYNLASTFCMMSCSRNQSTFLKVVGSQVVNKTNQVTALDYYINNDFADGMYTSCQDVIMPQGNTKVVDVMCGSDCNPQKWLNFMAAFSPFTLTFMFYNETVDVNGTTFTPMNTSNTPCSESVKPGQDACSCADCRCPLPPFPPLPVPWVILGIHGMTVVMVIVFAGLMIIFSAGFVIQIYYKGRQETDKVNIDDYHSDSYPPLSVSEEVSHRQKLGRKMEMSLQLLFRRWGTFCASHPWWVLLVGLVVITVLGLGLLMFTVTTDPVELWSSKNSQVRLEKDYFDEHFTPFYRIEQVIITRKNGSIFDLDFLLQVLELQQNIVKLTSTVGNKTIYLEDICFSPLDNNKCTIQSVLNWFQNNITNLNKPTYMSHIKTCMDNPFSIKDDVYSELPCMGDYGGPVYPYVALGGFEGKEYINATALIIAILVNNGNTSDANINAEAWEKEYVNFMKNYSNPEMRISFTSERSIEDELNRESQSDLVTISISYLVMFIYVSFALGHYSSCDRFLIDSKISLGLCGVLIVMASVVASLGIFSYAGVSATLIIIEVIPFLVLAVGVDNIFILVQAYQRDRRQVTESKEEQIGRVLGNVAPSMLLASFSESTCFFLGALTDMPAVHVFALYAGMALLIDFLLQITCFVALLSIDANRYEENRLDLCCCIKASKEPEEESKSFLYKVFSRYYTPTLLLHPIRATVIVVFTAWMCTSLAFLDKIDIGLDQQLSMPQDSYVLDYFKALNKYLSVGPPVYFVVKSGYKYSSYAEQNKLCSTKGCSHDSLYLQVLLASQMSNNTYIAYSSQSWIDDYFSWALNGQCCQQNSTGDYCPLESNRTGCVPCNITDPKMQRPLPRYFNEYVEHFLDENPDQKCPKGGHSAYNAAVELTPNGIGATNFMTYHTILKTSPDFIGALQSARKISDNITKTINETGIEVFPYSVFYVFYEQYLTIWKDSIKSLLISLGAVFVVTSLLTGLDFHSSIIITWTIVMIVVDLMGLMYFWEISLNAVSLVNLVMAIGISVEFCSHITRAFAVSKRGKRIRRAEEALNDMGSSVLSGITLTKFGGIMILAFAKSQIFEVFYFRMYLGIVLFGAAHGLIFLPVLLSIIGPAVNRAYFEGEFTPLLFES